MEKTKKEKGVFVCIQETAVEIRKFSYYVGDDIKWFRVVLMNDDNYQEVVSKLGRIITEVENIVFAIPFTPGLFKFVEALIEMKDKTKNTYFEQIDDLEVFLLLKGIPYAKSVNCLKGTGNIRKFLNLLEFDASIVPAKQPWFKNMVNKVELGKESVSK